MNVPRVIVDRGACADIVRLDNDRVVKAYRRKSHTHAAPADWEDHDAVTQAEFRFEVRAYERVQNIHELEIYVPKYYGCVDPISLMNSDDVSGKYLSGCGIVLEFIPGKAVKLAHVDSSVQPRAETIAERLRDEATVASANVWDASCFVPGTRAPFTLIDFAYWDGITEYQMLLQDGATLTKLRRTSLDALFAA